MKCSQTYLQNILLMGDLTEWELAYELALIPPCSVRRETCGTGIKNIDFNTALSEYQKLQNNSYQHKPQSYECLWLGQGAEKVHQVLYDG